ncbi:polyprenyl synthetase family protein [Agrilactobacillus yilanensis]|nr:farnesyl diphosphate synthase [Agrilactobacillus yilanensis]
MLNYQDFAKQVLPTLEQTIEQTMGQTVSHPTLKTAMQYSIGVGGKRLRPLLLLSTVASFGTLTKASYLPAAALELVHTYSLIHDDLPAMDNDDYRRGQLANHKKFGEAQAILAGDGLLTVAFEWLSRSEFDAAIRIKLVALLSQAAGPSQMVAGQYTDITTTGEKIDLTTLETMELQKTAALLQSAILMGATIAKVDAQQYEALTVFARNFGLAFQIADDISDFESGQDTAEKKATFATMLGLEAAKAYLTQTLTKAKTALNSISGPDLTLLDSYFEYFRQVR